MDQKAAGEFVEDVEHSKGPVSDDPRLNNYVEGSEEEKKLLRKIDLFLLPTIWLMCMFSLLAPGMLI